MTSHLPSVDLPAAASLTGIEPARIRFFHREFRAWFHAPSQAAGESRFEMSELELLCALDRWIFTEGHSLAAVEERLRARTRHARVIAVTSGKGGVGKTTVALNLATALAVSGRRTLLCDGDLGLANVHVFAGVNPKRTMVDLLQGHATADELLVEGPGGIRILPGASGLTELADLEPQALARLIREIQRLTADHEAVVLDTGAGISSRVVEFLRLADEIVVVAIPDIASMLDAYGIIKVAHEARLPGHLRLLVNLVSPGTDPEAVAERIRGCARRFLNLDLARLGWLPQDSALQDANQSRQPLVLSQPQSPSAQCLQQMAMALLADGSESPQGPAVAADHAKLPAADHARPLHRVSMRVHLGSS